MNTYDQSSLFELRTTLTVKRLIDIAVSLVALIVLIPVFLVISVVVAIDMRANPFFVQTRMGRNNRTFKILKFRTMRPETPGVASCKLENADQYITKLGAFLRRFSVDELPQVCNILAGQMSLVGPRPVMPIETELIEYRTRSGTCTVRPGLTGLAQINGRDMVTTFEKARMDAFYANNLSLKLDFHILLKTVGYVLRSQDIHEGAFHKHDDTMERSA